MTFLLVRTPSLIHPFDIQLPMGASPQSMSGVLQPGTL